MDPTELYELREASAFRPRMEMNLGGCAPVLSEFYQRELSIEQAAEEHIAGPAEPVTPAFEPVFEPVPAPVDDEPLPASVPEALSLTEPHEAEEAEEAE
jgi:hypothetical protein